MDNTKEKNIIDKIMDEILTEEDYLKRFKLIEQLDLFSRAIHTITAKENFGK